MRGLLVCCILTMLTVMACEKQAREWKKSEIQVKAKECRELEFKTQLWKDYNDRVVDVTCEPYL